MFGFGVLHGSGNHTCCKRRIGIKRLQNVRKDGGRCGRNEKGVGRKGKAWYKGEESYQVS